MTIPLAERIRPTQLSDVVGQPQLIGPQGILTRLLNTGHLPSIIFWGPPGCGKTTIARLIADHLRVRFAPFSAVLGGVPELRKLLDEAAKFTALGERTLLFIDEIHRFNKAQQDALLPHVESGGIILLGATTENPSFSVNRALLSRCRVFQLIGLDAAALDELVSRAATHAQGLPGLRIDENAREPLLRFCAGDGRRLLVMLESAWALCQPDAIDVKTIAHVAANPVSDHDSDGEQHYDVASAFIKSMRASDVQAALYYLARQIEGGEDPRFIARRLVIFASEDIGLADSTILSICTAALTAVQHIGLPEAIYPLTHATIACATAAKSNTTKSYFAAAEAVRKHPGASVPLFLRNAPTELMAELGYKNGYIYDHDTPEHFAGQACLPDELLGSVFYQPGPFGFEKEIAKRLEWWETRRRPRA
jgi:putative ATPase